MYPDILTSVAMSTLVLLLACAAACALPSNKNIIQDVEEINRLDVIGSEKKPARRSNGRRMPSLGIVGGHDATIDMYPFAVSVLGTQDLKLYDCMGSGIIINTRSVLTAVSYRPDGVKSLRFRVGSPFPSGGGTVYDSVKIIDHPDWMEHDISIVRSATTIVYVPYAVQPAVTAPADYDVADDEKVWAVGFGYTYEDMLTEVRLRHVQIYTINQSVCEKQYTRIDPASYVVNITDNKLCAGVPGIGGKGPCTIDEGGPLIHNGIVVGLNTWGIGCARRLYPSVYTRVSHYADWILLNK